MFLAINDSVLVIAFTKGLTYYASGFFFFLYLTFSEFGGSSSNLNSAKSPSGNI
jgi:hypothetical protein